LFDSPSGPRCAHKDGTSRGGWGKAGARRGSSRDGLSAGLGVPGRIKSGKGTGLVGLVTRSSRAGIGCWAGGRCARGGIREKEMGRKGIREGEAGWADSGGNPISAQPVLGNRKLFFCFSNLFINYKLL
jgi:hypothetical protein